MAALVLEGVIDWRTEDSGCALIIDIYDEANDDDGSDDGVFVSITEWSDAKDHLHAALTQADRIRVTVEVIS
jgi:hypothetical protein